MNSISLHVHYIKEDAMMSFASRMQVLSLVFVVATMLAWPVSQAQAAEGQQKVKVLYHVDGKDPEVAKYALALINKHIDAEGGPDKIDVELVVHGPALELFEKDKMDPEMTKRFDQIIEKGAKAEMCQVSMKAFGKTIDNLAKGFVATLHPVAVKRIADLQKEGYLYIKP
ncbi:MAG TPA: DsrE family protein [Nitrospiraceae bacterium]|nr:DsrE family protein [Nitrospiraceae bacterium]